jgi:hypothetical protein
MNVDNLESAVKYLFAEQPSNELVNISRVNNTNLSENRNSENTMF